MRHMNAKLVRAAGARLQGDQRHADARRLDQLQRAVRWLTVRVHRHHLTTCPTAFQQRASHLQRFGRCASDERQIGFFHVLLLEGTGQMPRRNTVFRQQQHARCVLVDAVHQPHSVLVPLGKRLKQAVDMANCSRPALNGKARRLVDGKPALAFGKMHRIKLFADLRSCLRHLFLCDRRVLHAAFTKMRRQAQCLPHLQPCRRFCLCSVQPDQASAQHLFHRPLFQPRDEPAQIAVDTSPILGFGHLMKPPVGLVLAGLVTHPGILPRNAVTIACVAKKAASDRPTDSPT